MNKYLLLGAFFVFVMLAGSVSATNINSCTNIISSGSYYLTADIINSTTSPCMNISANDVTLDCQGHTIDGNDATYYGIYIHRGSSTNTNVTVKNCIVTDWGYGIHLSYSNSNNITNITANSNYQGITLSNSNSNNITNITVNSNEFGIGLYSSDSSTITDITVNSNYYGIYLENSDSSTLTNTIANYNTLGISLSNSNSNNLTNITANSNSQGVHLSSSDSSTLTNITANSNEFGISLYSSNSNTFTNVFSKNNTKTDFYLEAGTASYCTQTLTNVNGTDNKPILFYNSTVNISNWDNNVSEIILCNADNSIIDNLTLNREDTANNGLFLTGNTENTIISNSEFNNTYYGIHLSYSNSNNITNITANSNTYGIYLYNSNSNNLTNITANSNSQGIYLYYANSNTISSSRIENNSYGIHLDNAGSSSPNKIYNNLLNQTTNVYFSGTEYTNYWNTTNQTGTRIYSAGTHIGGNYWTNPSGTGYSDTCTDSDANGFCDDYYDVKNDTSGCDSNNCDYLPLSDEYNIGPSIALNSPANGANNQDVNGVNLNVTLTDPTPDTINATFYWNNGTVICTLNNDYATGTDVNCTTGSLSGSTTYYWYVNATDGYTTTKSTVWYFTTESAAPVITKQELYPAAPEDNDDLLLNITCTDTNNDSVTAYWECYKDDVKQNDFSSSVLINVSTETTVENISNVNTSIGESWYCTCWCGDGESNSSVANTSTRTIAYQYNLGTVTYDVDINELSNIDISILVSYNPVYVTATNATLVWDGTEYHYNTSSSYPTGNYTNITYTRTIYVPKSEDETNISFYWNITLNNGTEFYDQSATYNQTIHSSIGNCSGTANVTSLVISLFDEITRDDINGTMYLVFQSGGYNYTFSATDSHNLTICVKDGTSVTVDEGYIEYWSDDSVLENYYLINAILNTAPQDLDLYSLNTSYDTLYEITVRDEDYQEMEGVYIKLQRYYPDTNEYTTVEMTKTGEFGKGLLHLEEENIWYRFLIQNSTDTLLTSTPRKYVCQSLPCTIEFTISSADSGFFSDLDDIDDFEYAITYNNVTRQIRFEWNDLTGTMSKVAITAWYGGYLEDRTAICTTVGTTTSGVIYCDISSYNGTVYVDAYLWRSPAQETHVTLDYIINTAQSAYTFFEREGLFWGVLLMMVVVLIGMSVDIKVGVVAGVGGLMAFSVLGLIALPWAALGFIIGVAVLILYGLKHEGVAR